MTLLIKIGQIALKAYYAIEWYVSSFSFEREVNSVSPETPEFDVMGF